MLAKNMNKCNLTRLGGVLAEARQRLVATQTDPVDADILLAFVLGQDRSYLLAYPEAILNNAQLVRFEDYITQRCAGVPVAYLMGTRDFWSLSLQVNEHTLIPRPETEHLVETALRLGAAEAELRVLDLGTGSGAVALALAQERPQWQITAADNNPLTLAMARQNAQHLGLNQVRFVLSDWFAGIEGQYDLVISNPPYIAATDPHMAQGDLRFEPRAALVSGTDGLQAIRQIVRQTSDYLQPNGWLLLEHGAEQGKQCRVLLDKHGLINVFTDQDLAGLDRLSGGKRTNLI